MVREDVWLIASTLAACQSPRELHSSETCLGAARTCGCMDTTIWLLMSELVVPELLWAGDRSLERDQSNPSAALILAYLYA